MMPQGVSVIYKYPNEYIHAKSCFVCMFLTFNFFLNFMEWNILNMSEYMKVKVCNC